MLQATSRVHPQRNLKRSLVTFKDDYPHWSLPLFQVTLFYFYFFNLFFILFHYSPIDSNSIFSLIYAFKCLFIYIYIYIFFYLFDIKLLGWEWTLLHHIMRFFISKKTSFPLSARFAKGVWEVWYWPHGENYKTIQLC